MDEENWKDIPGYEGYYQVSDKGRVKRVKYPRKKTGGILSPCDYIGYKSVQLCMNGIPTMHRVHKLVMLAFVGMRPDGLEINHINGVPSDNQLSNLEYVTHEENMRHADKVLGRWDARRKPPKPNAFKHLTPDIVRDIRRLVANGEVYQNVLAEHYGVTKGTISRIVSRQSYPEVD